MTDKQLSKIVLIVGSIMCICIIVFKEWLRNHPFIYPIIFLGCFIGMFACITYYIFEQKNRKH